MSISATLAPPDEVWSAEQYVIAAQQAAYRFFEAQNWIWAAKMLIRAERLARRLAPDRNPFEQAGRELIETVRRRAAIPSPSRRSTPSLSPSSSASTPCAPAPAFPP